MLIDLETGIAIYSSIDKILKVSNAEENRGYALKKDGNEMSKFVTSTENSNYLDTRNITVGDNNYDYGENISIDVPLMFSSTLLVKGLDNLKINGSTKTDLNVKIMKNGQKLNLQLGPKFNYKKHELFLSLHSQSNITISLNFNLKKFILTYPAKQSTDSNDTYEISTGPPGCLDRTPPNKQYSNGSYR